MFREEYKNYPDSLSDFGRWCFFEEKTLVLGKGGFGEVYLGYYKNPPQWVAIKRCDHNFISKGEPKEIEIMKRVSLPVGRHNNIVDLLSYDPCCDKNTYYIVLGLYDYTLSEFLKKIDGEERQVKHVYNCSLTKQLLAGLQYLHKQKVVHCDLKPNNVMVDYKTSNTNNVIVKLVDFGISREVSPLSTIYTKGGGGHLAWSAPGTFLNRKTTISVKHVNDVFTALVLMVYVFSGGEHPFFERKDPTGTSQNISSNDTSDIIELDNSCQVRENCHLYFPLKLVFNDYFATFNKYYTYRNNNEKEEYKKLEKKLTVSEILSEFEKIYCVKYPTSTLSRRYTVMIPCTYENCIRPNETNTNFFGRIFKKQKPNKTPNETYFAEAVNATSLRERFQLCDFKPINTETNWTKQQIVDTIASNVEKVEINEEANEDIYLAIYILSHGEFNIKTDGCIFTLKTNKGIEKIGLYEFLTEIKDSITTKSETINLIVAMECCQIEKNIDYNVKKTECPENIEIITSSQRSMITMTYKNSLKCSDFAKVLHENIKPGEKLNTVLRDSSNSLREKFDKNFLKMRKDMLTKYNNLEEHSRIFIECMSVQLNSNQPQEAFENISKTFLEEVFALYNLNDDDETMRNSCKNHQMLKKVHAKFHYEYNERIEVLKSTLVDIEDGKTPNVIIDKVKKCFLKLITEVCMATTDTLINEHNNMFQSSRCSSEENLDCPLHVKGMDCFPELHGSGSINLYKFIF